MNTQFTSISYKEALGMAKREGFFEDREQKQKSPKITYAQALNRALTIDMPTQVNRSSILSRKAQDLRVNTQQTEEFSWTTRNQTATQSVSVNYHAPKGTWLATPL